MRILLGLVLALSVSFAEDIKCDHIENGYGYIKKLKSVLADEIVDANVPVMGGEITCTHDNYRGNKTNNNITRGENGNYKGLKYRFYYKDGSGKIQGSKDDDLSVDSKWSWGVRCKVDPIDDTHFCSMKKDDITIAIMTNGVNIIVGEEHYPETIAIVRIDKNTPFKSLSSGIFSIEDSAKIIKEMSNGSQIVTRYQKWPHKANIDKTFDLYELEVAIEILNNIYSSINTKMDGV